MKQKPGVLLAGALLLVGGCGDTSPGIADPSTGPVITASPRASEPSEPTEPTEPSESRSPQPVTPAIPTAPLYVAGDIAPGLQPLIDQATADLAGLLGVDASDITTHAAVLVTWPDASVGCPRPGMNYPQVMTDGSIIELAYDGVVYRYHSGGRSGPFQCPTPLTRAPAGSGAA